MTVFGDRIFKKMIKFKMSFNPILLVTLLKEEMHTKRIPCGNIGRREPSASQEASGETNPANILISDF